MTIVLLIRQCKMRIIILLNFMIINFLSYSCTCGTSKPISEVKIDEMAIVFVGRIKEIKLKGDSIEIVVKVSKGLLNANKNEMITIYTLKDPGLCGISAQVDSKWYFFVDDKRNGINWVDDCDRGGDLSQKKIRKSDYGEENKFHKKMYLAELKRLKKEIRFLEQRKKANAHKELA